MGYMFADIDNAPRRRGGRMNAADRKQVSTLVSQLEDMQAKFDYIRSELRDLADAEQNKFDNMNEGLQASEQGQQIEEAASNLSEAADADSIDDAINALGNIA